MANYAGMRSTSTSITSENLLVRNIGPKIAMLEPNEAPLITFLNKLSQRSKTITPRVEWVEDDFVARWASNSSATVGGNSASVTITVASGEGVKFAVNDLVAIPRAIHTATTPEVVRVTAISTDTLTVVRGVGSTTISAINPDASLTIIGSAYEEGDVLARAKSTVKATRITYTQIFRDAIQFTRTQAASSMYGINGSERKREQMKKLKEHKINLNRAALWGVASESLTGGPNGLPVRTTAGINSVISTNTLDVSSGILTRKTFEEFSRMSFRYGSRQKLLLCAPIYKSAITEWANSHLRLESSSKVLGVDVQKLVTGHGTWMIVNDWMLEDGVSGQNGFGDVAFSIDIDNCEFKHLSNNGENGDTHLLMNRNPDGSADKYTDEYLTEGGFCFKQEKTHAKLYGVTDYSA